MKKVLSILAVSSIAVSTPLATIACGKNSENPTDEWDFDSQKILMLNIVSGIFQNNLKKDFDPFFYIDEESSAFDHKYNEFAENLEDFNDTTSARYKSIKASIENIINWNTILKDVQTGVVDNVNFKQLLVDNQSPLKNGFEVSKINFELQPAAKTVLINFEITSDVSIRDKDGSTIFETINFNSKIAMFQAVDVAEEFNKIKTEYLNHFNDEEISGSFTIESDIGNLKTTAGAISSSLDIKNKVQENLSIIMDQAQTSNIVLLTDNLAIKTSDNAAVDSAAGEVITSTFLSASRESDINGIVAPELRRLYWDAIFGVEGKEEELLNNILKSGMGEEQENGFIKNPPSVLSNINDLIKKHENMSNVFNCYFLNFNYLSGYAQYLPIRTAMESQGSKFKLDMDRDEKTIALFKTEILDLQLEYSGEKFDLPAISIIVRQETKKANTQELEKQFFSDSLKSFRKITNLNESSPSSNPTGQYYLNKPDGWEQYINQELPIEDYFNEIWSANPEAESLKDNLEITVKIFQRNYQNDAGAPQNNPTFMKFNQNGDVYFHSGENSQNYNLPELRYNFFSKNMSGFLSNGFSITRAGFKNNFIDPSVWKFKS
ncbi:hypothetical protein SSABA_v1c03480 [Spiroplasma sabaudiense Ar-1343]|uniref:Lipoprotein n=1 Tax=Spiroplasma sabaudiense Ar-1343 TaxID=1276257 RepID=W6A9R1_9MOLU|nr:hypothetical protein [Spiroplasma sabaudiense]AHI53757.1 hypothetical protein SSABA_v1c03480 [Spiroplasma sabaudiense Ar-1343]